MAWSSVILDWQGPILSGEQMHVLEKVALQYLHRHGRAVSVHFEHPLCEGIVKRKGETSLGTFAGTHFHAYLGTQNERPWTCDFILLDPAEDAHRGNGAFMFSHPGEDGKPVITKVDRTKTNGAQVESITMQ